MQNLKDSSLGIEGSNAATCWFQFSSKAETKCNVLRKRHMHMSNDIRIVHALLSALILYDIIYRLYIGDMFLKYLDALRVCLQGH